MVSLKFFIKLSDFSMEEIERTASRHSEVYWGGGGRAGKACIVRQQSLHLENNVVALEESTFRYLH